MTYKIHILQSQQFTPNENAFLAPLHRIKSALKKKKIELSFFRSDEKNAFDCDTLILSSKFFSTWWQRYGFEHIQEFLSKARGHANQIFWFDLADSTGTTHFKVLPYVDKYLKCQILKEKKEYQKKYYGMRIATDFYHHNFNIEDTIPDEPHLNVFPHDEELKKIVVGWNTGLAYYGRWRHYLEPLTWNKPALHKHFKPKFHLPHTKRSIPCSGRFGCSYPRHTVSFPRYTIKEKLQSIMPVEKINMRNYFREMRNSTACVSPFGLGEISLRDFEIVLSGAAMIKQNMDHLDTWPNLWKTNETYLDFAWDFADLNQKIEYARENPEEMLQLARNAQTHYHDVLFLKEGPGSFMEHFLNIIYK